MNQYLLPQTRYEEPIRLARKHTLNTIIEDTQGESEEEKHIWREGEEDAHRRGRTQYLAPRSVRSTSPVPSLTSSSISADSYNRQFEDYDSLDEISDDGSDISLSIMTDPSSVRSSLQSESLRMSDDDPKRCPSLVIPSPSLWPSVPESQPLQVSPPRPPKVPLSPAALSMLGHDLPRLSNPPSLAGSFSTDPHVTSSGPVTPDLHTHLNCGGTWGQGPVSLEANSGQAGESCKKSQRPKISICTQSIPEWSRQCAIAPENRIGSRELPDSPVLGLEDGSCEIGVELPLDALATLQNLSLETPAQNDAEAEQRYATEMQEARLPLRPSSADITPASATSEYSISGFSVPSPGGFFASLGSNARHTWHISSVPPSALPPSSTTAEQFYNCPWNKDFAPPVEQIIEVDGSSADTDGPPTARQMPLVSARSTQTAFYVPQSPQPQHAFSIADQDEDYEKAIQEVAEKSLDRTSMWLAQQTSYLSALRETNPVNDVSAEAELELKRSGSHARTDSLGSPIKKAVHYLETETAEREGRAPELTEAGDSTYYHAFQHIKNTTEESDAFRHRLTRSDSIKSVRLCLPHEHVKRLQGEYHSAQFERPHAQRPISMMPGKEQSVEDQTTEQKVIASVEKERQALEQVNARTWIIEASKYLAGGSLLNSPARHTTIKTPKLGDIQNGRVKNPARVLDLGGLPNGDWAWHCAREFPVARIYTATTERHLIDSRIRGPRNHCRTAVTHLWKLPYPDHYFHAISARSLYAHLKVEKPLGEDLDEYDLCLRECLRCLKPGGYLEFSLQDSEIVNAGSHGTAVSVEFGFNLKTRGYDPTPTKSWLSRVKRAGFDDIKRAWMFMPMGSPIKETPQVPETPPPNVSTFENESRNLQAVPGHVGSTEDAATMSGLVSSWAWEQWLLRLHLEMGKENLLEGVGAVLEEGKGSGAGWRCLSGWARKPLEMDA